jgi:hypothetical protein
MRFRDKDPEQVSADALRMAERKQAEGCSPCAEVYRELAKDPGRRRLLRRAALGAGGLVAASLVDVGGVLAGPQSQANDTATVQPVSQTEADRLGAQLRDHSAVAPLSRFLEQRGQRFTRNEGLAVTLNGQAVGMALIQHHGADAFVMVGKALDGTIVPGGVVHGTQAFVLRNGAVVLDRYTSARLASLHHAPTTPAGALRAMVGPSVARAANCTPNQCYALAAGCGFFSGCCFVGPNPVCCPFGAGFCTQLIVCCFG